MEEVQRKYDAVVIGGGFLGLSCAYHSAKNGLKVALIDKGLCGSGQSAKSGGQALAGFELTASELINKFGFKHANDLYAYTQSSRLALKELLLNTDVIEGNGGLVLALNEQHEQELIEELRNIQKLGSHSRLITFSEIKEFIDSPKVVSGIFDPDTFHINPEKMISYMKNLAIEAGVHIYENTKITRLADDYAESNAGQKIYANNIVIVAGLGSDSLLGYRFLRRVMPVQTLMSKLKFNSDFIFPQNACAYDARKVMSYFKKAKDGFYFGGCDSQFRMSLAKIKKVLLKEFNYFFPNQAVHFDKVWQEGFDVTLTSLPHVEKSANRYVAYGLNGHGVTLSFGFGRTIAHHMSGIDNQFGLISNKLKAPRFPFIPLANSLVANLLLKIWS